MNTTTTKYSVTLEEDSNGDLVLPFPEELMKELGWKEGDVLEFDIKDNEVVITNKSKS